MVERGIGSLLTLLRCSLAGEKVHSSWPDRLPQILWYMNTLPHSGTGFSPYYLEHGRDPRSVASRALDTAAVPKRDQPWLATLKARLNRADVIQKRVHLEEKIRRQRLERLPYHQRREVQSFKPGDFAYLRVEAPKSKGEGAAAKFAAR